MNSRAILNLYNNNEGIMMNDNNQEYQIISQDFIEEEVSDLTKNITSIEPFNGVDIFSDTSKLPESCKNELKKHSLNIDDKKIIDLFEFKKSLSIDEIII